MKIEVDLTDFDWNELVLSLTNFIGYLCDEMSNVQMSRAEELMEAAAPASFKVVEQFKKRYAAAYQKALEKKIAEEAGSIHKTENE